MNEQKAFELACAIDYLEMLAGIYGSTEPPKRFTPEDEETLSLRLCVLHRMLCLVLQE